MTSENNTINRTKWSTTFAKRPTVCVTCGGWESRFPVETEKTQSQKTAEKRAAYPPSAARIVSWRCICFARSTL